MQKFLLFLLALSLICCAGSDDSENGILEDSSFYEEGPTVEIDDEALSDVFWRMGLINKGANEIHTRKLDTIKHLEFVGSNPSVFNYLPSLTSLEFPNSNNSQCTREFYLEAFSILESTNRLTNLDSLVIEAGEGRAVFGHSYYFDYDSNRSGQFWKKLRSIKKLVIDNNDIPWGITTELMPNLEHLELGRMPCTYTNGLYYDLNYNIELVIPNKEKLKFLKVVNCAIIQGISDFINLEHLEFGGQKTLPTGTDISRMENLKYLSFFRDTDCSKCLVVSQEQIENLYFKDWPDSENENRKRTGCTQQCASFGGGYCRNGYPYLYQVGQCRTICDFDPNAGGGVACN